MSKNPKRDFFDKLIRPCLLARSESVNFCIAFYASAFVSLLINSVKPMANRTASVPNTATFEVKVAMQ